MIMQTIPRYPEYMVSQCGKVWSIRSRKMLKSWLDKGYPRVNLSIRGKRTEIGIHQLMGITFLNNPLGLKWVAHKDDRRSNNVLSNLYWATAKQNGADMIRNGHGLFGAKNHATKLNEKDVLSIRKLIAKEWGQKRISEKFAVSRQLISAINCGHVWRHLK